MDSQFNPLNQYQHKSNLNEAEIVFRYELEQKVMDAITTGNYEAIQTLLETEMDEFPFNPLIRRLPRDPLRDRKNGLVIRNTFCRIAARSGGLPSIYLHLISEKYALMIEQATSVDYLNNVLSINMIKEYCQSVQHFSTLNYSKSIKQIVSYLSNHLTEPIQLSTVAEQFHINAAHLSRKFKQETSFTFIDYINHQRVEYAKLLFHEGYTSITEVASHAGFNSSSYFSKVFKKNTGISPKAYLKEGY